MIKITNSVLIMETYFYMILKRTNMDLFSMICTLSDRIGKVAAWQAEVARSIPDWAEALHRFILCTRSSGGTAHEGGGCDQSIGSTVSDAIVRYYYYYYLKKLAMQGQEREIHTLSTYRGKEEVENSWRQKKERATKADKNELYLLLIVPERYWEANKSPVVLRGSAAGGT